MLNNFKLKANKLRGYLFKLPAFPYKEETFLKRFTLSEWSEYELWLLKNRNFTLLKLKKLYNKAVNFKLKPKISIIMPVYNPDPIEFKQSVDSILWQAYPYWELCIVDDFSDNRDYLKVLGRLIDRRIRVKVKDKNTGIADTTQHALEMATGEYVATMDQDDELYPDALFSFVNVLQHHDVDYFYSDRDMISPNGKRFMHLFKPDWSPEFLLTFNYAFHLEIFKKQLVLDVGGFRKDYEGSQDYDLVLRVTEKTERIYHHPMVLYSWRQTHDSIASNNEMKSYVFESGVKAVADTVKRRNLPVKEVVENSALWRGHYKIVWDEKALLKERIFLFTISRDLTTTDRLKMLFESTMDSSKIEFVSTDYDIENINRELIKIDDEAYVFFCHDTIVEIVSPSLIDVIGYLSIDGVSAVGCKFVDMDNKIFNAGFSITTSGNILFAYRGSPHNEVGYCAVASAPRNVSFVFPAFWGCKSTSLRDKGFLKSDKGYFHSTMNYFKEVVNSGERIVSVPHMCFRVNENILNYDNEMKAFSEQWLKEGLNDKYYNPNLTDMYEDYRIKL